MSYKKQISGMVSKLGAEGVDKLTDFLDGEAHKAHEPWQRAILDFFAEAGRKHGPEGFSMAQDAVERLLNKGEPQDIRKVTSNLLIASNLLAQLQTTEADRKERARKFVAALGKTLGALLKAILGILL